MLATDPEEARSIARTYTRHYLALDNYVNNPLRLGWGDDDLVGDGSDTLVDAVVACGAVAAIQERVAAHFEEGADHVCVQVLNGPADETPIAELRQLSRALLEL